MIGYIILGAILLIIGIIFAFYFIRHSQGKMSLEINKKDFVVGETIKGTIKLNLKKPIEAKELTLELVGVKTDSGRRNSGYSNILFETVKQIDGQKTYNIGETIYNFELFIPEDAKPKIENPVMNTLVKTAQFVTGQRVDWYLKVNLDMKGLDINKTLRIYIN